VDPEQVETPITPDDEWQKADYELTDMQVQTVGLVPAGANLMNDGFILLKNQEVTGMTKDIQIEEVVPEDAPDEVKGVIQMIKDGVAKVLSQSVIEPEPEDTPPDDPEPVEKEGEPEPPVTPAAPDPPATDDTHLEKLLKAQTDRFEALLKQQKIEFDGQVTKLETELAKANERAEKAEQYADTQTEQAERQAHVQKALAYKALPVGEANLGDLLYRLNKGLDEETFKEVEALLQAADKQAWTAGIFKEMGTARSPEQVTLESKVEKMVKDEGISYADALLKLSPEEQMQLMEGDNG